MTFNFVEILPLSQRHGNCILFAAIRWHDFGNRPAIGRPSGHFSRHPDAPLVSISPRRQFPRPMPERVFVVDHQSGSGFSGIGLSILPPRPVCHTKGHWPGFRSSNQPDQERTTAYRDSSGPESRSDAHCAPIVGDWEEPSGESLFKRTTSAPSPCCRPESSWPPSGRAGRWCAWRRRSC